jgi:molecular chaperone GrpE (heat shock protein)
MSELPQGLVGAVAEATAEALRPQLEALAQRIEAAAGLGPAAPPEGSPDTPLARVWTAAGLALRLRFVRGFLPAGHPRQPALAEVESLVELCGDAAALEAWLSGYPSAFAEAGMSLEAELRPDPRDDGDLLACEVLAAVREEVARSLGALGVTWIVPRAGDEVSLESEVVGEEPDDAVSPGRVKALRRPGFRRRGRLELPAQVIRAARAQTVRSVEPAPAPEPVLAPSPASREPAPDWLRALRLQPVTGDGTVLMEALETLAASAPGTAPEAAMRRALEPLLGLLATGWAGEELQGSPAWAAAAAAVRLSLLEWLRRREQLELIVPAEQSAVDPASMEVVGERRTAHAHERGRVARVQRAGLLRGERVLIPARVIRYEAGGSA